MEIVLNPKFIRRGRKATQICATVAFSIGWAIVYENFVEAMKPIRQFWFSIVTLPPEGFDEKDSNTSSADRA